MHAKSAAGAQVPVQYSRPHLIALLGWTLAVSLSSGIPQPNAPSGMRERRRSDGCWPSSSFRSACVKAIGVAWSATWRPARRRCWAGGWNCQPFAAMAASCLSSWPSPGCRGRAPRCSSRTCVTSPSACAPNSCATCGSPPRSSSPRRRGHSRNGGSRFTVRLPLAPGALPALPEPEALPQGAPRRVLVVDDNRDAADSLAAVLGVYAHDVQVRRHVRHRNCTTRAPGGRFPRHRDAWPGWSRNCATPAPVARHDYRENHRAHWLGAGAGSAPLREGRLRLSSGQAPGSGAVARGVAPH